MKLEFDSISELTHFLNWAGNYGMMACDALPATTLKFPTLDTGEGTASTGVETQVYTDGTTATGPAPLPEQSPAQQAADSPEPAKRKRRTKAEIEADAKETADVLAAKDRNDVAAGLVEQPEGTQGTNPFDQPANAAEAPAEGAETLNGDKKPEPAGDEAGESVVTPYQHLTRAREFIAKHGVPKYNESFAKAGLDANVMGYTAYQRGVHMTALDELEKA